VNLFIAGASGRTGRILTELALDRGHSVTAFVRRTSRTLPPHDRLTVVVGDVFEPSTFAFKLAGQDAVVSLLAPRPRRSGRVYVEGTRALADSAAAAGVRRFVVVSAEGAGADPRSLPVRYRLVLRIPVVARLYPDIARMESELAVRSDLEWTVVAPPILTNGAPTGRYRVSTEPVVPGGLRLSRADLASFLLDTVERGSHVRERVAVAH